jgi:DNA-binding SARP family transcriptional activator
VAADADLAAPPRFRLLGPLVVTAEHGAPVDLGGHRQAAVLAALLVQANRVVPRDRLVQQVWGNQAPPTAPATLQAYLSNLRRLLEPGRAPRAPSQVIVRRATGYVAQVDPGELDALRFEELVARARARTATAPEDARRDFVQALALWQGAALADFPDEPFAAGPAARWESLRLSAREDLFELQLAAGEHASALPEMEALLRGHPLRERLCGQLIVAQYRTGLQTEALETYHTLRRALAEELGLQPGPALQQLERAVLTHEPSLLPGDPAERALDGTTSGPGHSTPGRTSARQPAPIVGRRSELARFATALDDARAGRGSLLLVAGEPGIGKTRLLEAMLDVGRRAGATVALGRCFEDGGPPPYWPWVRVVRDLAATAAGADVLARAAPPVRRLRSWLPEGDTGGAEQRANPHWIAESVLAVCRQLAADWPLVIALDDLHGADPDSLTVLSLLAAEHPAGTVVVGTHRTGDVPDGHGLTDLLATVSRFDSVHRLPLSRLRPDAVAELVEVVNGAPVDPAVSADIHSRSSGNALFAVELIRLLQSEPELAAAGGIPPGVRDVIRRRVGRLPGPTRALLSVAAVLGRIFDLDVVAEVAAESSGVAEMPPLEAMEIALTAQLVEEGDLPGRFQFSHALVQEALRDAQTSLRRAHLHRALAERLEDRHAADPTWWQLIAHHAVEGVPVTGPGAALAPVARAADHAAVAAAARLALELRERHLQLVLLLPPSTERDRLELAAQESLSRAVAAVEGWVSGRLERTAGRVVVLARSTGRTPDTIAGLMTRATHRLACGRFADAAAAVAEIDALAAASGLPLAALCGHLRGGVTAYYLGHTQEAQRRFLAGERLLEVVDPGQTGSVLEPPGQQSLLGSYWAHRAALTCLLGDPERGREQAARAVALEARSRDTRFSVSVALVKEATLHYNRDDPQSALESGRRAVADSREVGYPELEALGAVVVAWAAARTEQGTSAAVREAVLAVPPLVRVEALHEWGMVADAALHAGRPTDVLDAVDRGLAAGAETGARMWLPELHRLRGEALLTLRRGDEAAGQFERGAHLARETGALLVLRRIGERIPVSAMPPAPS